ncbi:MAG: thiolase family protein [Burkholderiales bacterium]|nr:MAG: thiolase family protein [Burkholderiales bacterium]
MDIGVIGWAMHPPADAIRNARLEEIAFRTARAALDDADIERRQLDSVTLGACDELDGRSISSMLLAAPSGAYLKDEIRVTDSGMTALALSAMRVASGRFDLALVISWNQTSVVPVEDVMRMRAEPFFLRPVGMNATIADGLFAGAVGREHGLDEAAVADLTVERQRRAQANPRGLRRAPATREQVLASAVRAWPLRAGHQAPITDGAFAFVLASPRWLKANPAHRPIARLRAMSWSIDSYRLDAHRLGALDVFAHSLSDVLARSGRGASDPIDVIELEAQTGYHDAAFTRKLAERPVRAISPSGGTWAQNPLFCTGLANAAEAVLQVAGRAGPTQVPGARFALAHGCHGFAQQAHVFAAFERVES